MTNQKHSQKSSRKRGPKAKRDVATDVHELHPSSDLGASAEILSAVFQSTDDAIWAVDSERFGLIAFNPAADQTFKRAGGVGLRVGMTPDDVVPPERTRWWKESYRRVLRTGAFQSEYEYSETGEVFRFCFNPLLCRKRVLGISVFGRNITASAEAERELEASLARYRQLVALSHNWIWEADDNGRYSYVGPQCREILGYEPAELRGKTRFDFMPGPEVNRVRPIFEWCAEKRRSVRALQNTVLHKDGHLVVLETNAVPIINEEGRLTGYRGMDQDITDRKRAEETLRESEGRLRLALEGGRMYAFEWDFKTDRVRRSGERSSLLEAPDSAREITSKEFLVSLHPSDRARYIEVLRELSPERSTYVALYRLHSPDRATCWIETRGRGFFDDTGNLMRVIGIASDVTARKEAEEALRQLSARLIDAQEEERKRFARELHDGVSQSLALISSEVAEAASAPENPEIASILDRVYGKLQDVVADISHLSHELHPTTLKHLGLTAAIRFLCREVSESHGIDVEFAEKGDPQQTSKEIALCLYRIAQEGLQNIVKHSGSRRAHVQLGGNSDEITLCIADDGVGFDTRTEKSGLGLVSMRERLRLVGGKISIRSRRNSGTRIEANVPLMQTTAIKVAA